MTSATSTFAASTCGSARPSPAARAIPPWRGSSACTRAGGGVGGDPVADGGQVGGGRRLVGHAARRRAGERAVRGHEVEPAAMDRGDAGGDQVGALERREGGVEARGPAEGGEAAREVR